MAHGAKRLLLSGKNIFFFIEILYWAPRFHSLSSLGTLLLLLDHSLEICICITGGGGGGGGGVPQENEMSSGVMNFKDSFLSSSKFYGQSYRSVFQTFEGECTARLRSLDPAIGGSSKDVLYFALCSSELVEPHIIPLKVRIAVALKEEAK